MIEPVRELARRTIDIGSIAGGLLNPFSTIGDSIAAAYREHLLGTRTLQDIPDHPRFVINASNVQTGALWRFSKAYMGDYRVGRVEQPNLELAVAVGASSAFPPFLSPVHLRLPDGIVHPDPGADLHCPPYTTHLVLSDGGVYDNLGLEPIFKRYQTVLVGDAGAQLAPEGEPASDWARHSRRVTDLIDHQVRSLRRRVLIEAYRNGTRQGAYWGIRTNIKDYQLSDSQWRDPKFRPDFRVRGGCTLLINSETGKLRYCIAKNIRSDARLTGQRDFMEGLSLPSLRATYTAACNLVGAREPFALLHRSR